MPGNKIGNRTAAQPILCTVYDYTVQRMVVGVNTANSLAGSIARQDQPATGQLMAGVPISAPDRHSRDVPVQLDPHDLDRGQALADRDHCIVRSRNSIGPEVRLDRF